MEASFVLFFAIFLLNINRRYISTFFTTMTGSQFACHNFHIATTDEARFIIFKRHPSYYASIKGELRVWLASNWSSWTAVASPPPWFTPRILASIPEDLLPKDATPATRELRRKSIEQEGARRNSALLGGGGGEGG